MMSEGNSSNNQSSALPTIIRCDGTGNVKKLIVQGETVKLSDIFQTSCPEKIRHFDILATNKVLIDASLNSSDGFQFNIVAPNWEVIGSQKIVLDGKQGEPHSSQKAKDGESGLPGLPGGASGNFFGVGVSFINGENFTISANGGAGGPGQDGGDGLAGKAGNDANPDMVVETDDGKRFFGTVFKEYLVFGEPGKMGGNGGDGGMGGLGGPSGKVKILNLGTDKIHGIKISISDGPDGLPGKGGLAGSGGKTGKDCRVEYTKSYAFWIEHGKNKSVTYMESNITATPGLEGRPGVVGQVLNVKNVPEALSETLLNYKMYLFENLPKSKELLNTFSSHPLVMEEYHLTDMIKELHVLEEKEEVSKLVYQFLLDQFYIYIANHKSQTGIGLLNLVYFAIKSKLRLSEPEILRHGRFNHVRYLKFLAERLESLNHPTKISNHDWIEYGNLENLIWVKSNDLRRHGQDSELIYKFTKIYLSGVIDLKNYGQIPIFEIDEFKKALKLMKDMIKNYAKKSEYWREINSYLDSSTWIDLLRLNKKILDHFQDVKEISDIYHQIQVLEDQTMLSQTLRNELGNEDGLVRIIKSNIVKHHNQMAGNAVKQLKFPFAKHFLDKFQVPKSLQIQHDLDYLILNSIQKIKKLANDLEYDGSVITKFDRVQEVRQLDRRYPIYTWDKANWGNDIDDLLSGKVVRLTADVTDPRVYEFFRPEYGVKCNDVEIRFVTSDKDQDELDDLLERFFAVRIIHSGDSYYRCGKEYYVIAGEELIIRRTYKRAAEDGYSSAWTKAAPFLSPYTTWTLFLYPADIFFGKRHFEEGISIESDYERLKSFMGHVDLNLLGRVQQFTDDLGVCRDENLNEMKKYYTVANVTNTQNSKSRKRKRSITQTRDIHKEKMNKDYTVANNLSINSNEWREISQLSIADGSFKGPKVLAPSTSFDLNSNLMLGQILMNKVFGTTFQRTTYLSPEQERHVKLKELQSQILPFLGNSSET